MKKFQFAQSMAKKALAVGLSVAMTVPMSLTSIGGTIVQAADDDLPVPFSTIQAGITEGKADNEANAPAVDALTDAPWAGGEKNAWTLKETDSAFVVANPFKGKTQLSEDIRDVLTDVTDPATGSKIGQKPVWTQGVTLTYWVKAKDAKNSAVLSFVGNDIRTYHKDQLQYYRICSEYEKGMENDPDSRFYIQKVKDATFEGKTVYTFDAWWEKNGYTSNTQKKNHVPEWCYYVPGIECNESDAIDAYMYIGKMNEDGTAAEALTTRNTVKVPNGFCKDATYYGELDVAKGSQLKQADVDGFLQISADNELKFMEDTGTEYSVNNNRKDYGTDKTPGMQVSNNLSVIGNFTKRDAEDPVLSNSDWHFVAYVITNDSVTAYVDGEDMDVMDYDVKNADGSQGPMTWAGKSFNASVALNSPTGAAHSAGSATYPGYYDSNCNGKLLMDWLIQDQVELKIGGASVKMDLNAVNNGAATKELGYWPNDTVAGTQIAKINVYDTPLSAAKVQDIYAAKDPKVAEEKVDVQYGNVDGDEEVTTNDAIAVLRSLVKLTTFDDAQTTAADVNQDGTVDVNDAITILKHLVKLIPELPVPKPAA